MCHLFFLIFANNILSKYGFIKGREIGKEHFQKKKKTLRYISLIWHSVRAVDCLLTDNDIPTDV